MQFKKTFFTITALIVAFMAGEIYLHLFKPSVVEPDSELGWKLKSNFDRTFILKTQKGKTYSAHFQTNEYGFRAYGKKTKNSLNILVIGDSYTADAFSNNDDAWFSIMAKKIESKENSSYDSVMVWAGGAGGYGTLQELILAKRIKKYFKPDLLVLQFCTNDFIDNSQDLEKGTFLRQLKFRRPYLSLDEKVQFDNSLLASLYRSYIFEYSRILNKIDSIINFFEYIIYAGYSSQPADFEKQNKESFEITKKLLIKFHEEFEDIPTVVINCSSDPDHPSTDWINLVRSAGFFPITAPSDEIAQQLKSGKDLLHSDGGHWNSEGNKLVGETLYERLDNLGYLNK